MVKIKIDSIEFESVEGSTIYDVASNAGIFIPRLCHKDGVEHYSSCMVCMVKDITSGKYLPSCSALVQNGMDIDASGERVLSLRRQAVELLLSEHRAECEAPCSVVCPAGYNIPLMNRYLADGNFEDAANLLLSETEAEKHLSCKECRGYCENACRRKKIDSPVSIRNMKLFISEKIKAEDDIKSVQKPKEKHTRFLSHIGKIEAHELNDWLKECKEAYSRHREINNNESAFEESGSCMHCDCRAADDCRLRDIAEQLDVKDPRRKLINAPIMRKKNETTGLIFENAKCIKCGLCVRICEDSTDTPSLCFIDRGFISIISEPLTVSFQDVLKTKTDECINVCPTGALEYYKNKIL